MSIMFNFLLPLELNISPALQGGRCGSASLCMRLKPTSLPVSVMQSVPVDDPVLLCAGENIGIGEQEVVICLVEGGELADGTHGRQLGDDESTAPDGGPGRQERKRREGLAADLNDSGVAEACEMNRFSWFLNLLFIAIING